VLDIKFLYGCSKPTIALLYKVCACLNTCSVFSFGKCSHHDDKKNHVQIVQRAFLEMLLQKLPYFEEKKSEVATFRH